MLRGRHTDVRGRNRYFFVRLVVVLDQGREQVHVLLPDGLGCYVFEQQQSGLTHIVFAVLFLGLLELSCLLLVVALCEYAELFLDFVDLSDIDQSDVLGPVNFLKFEVFTAG